MVVLWGIRENFGQFSGLSSEKGFFVLVWVLVFGFWVFFFVCVGLFFWGFFVFFFF